MPKTTKSWFTLNNQGEGQPVKVWIHGDIGSYDIEAIDLIKALQSVGSQDAEFRIQSYGGSVYEGLAMYNAIKAHKGKTIGIVDGLVASISSYFLMACDEIQMPENAKLMIHDPAIGAWGGENEIESALTQLKNAKQTIAEAYAERCGKSLDDVLQAMAKETWFTANQALEFGLIDAVIDAVDLSNCLKKVSATELQAKAFKHTPDDLLNQLVQPPATPTPEPLINQQSDPMPKPIDNDALQNALKNENQRQSTIRALCATHKVSDTLRDEMLNDLNCSAEDSSLKILQYLGSISINGQEPNAEQPSTGLTNTHIHVGNGNTIKDALQNALNARCGTGEIEKDNPYRLKTLLDMAEIAVGKDAKYCGNKNELVARAFNSGDFADIITESVRTVMRDEAQVRAPLWRDLANTENLPNFKETDLILINDAPDLMAVSEDGEYKSATIKGSGEKIQLASFGREIAFTRQAIINDEIALISKIPRKFMQSAYRLSDKLMFNAILSGKMGDGKSVFQAGGANKWGNLVNDIPAADYQTLVMALHKAFATATTSEGDALDLRGEILLANPDHASFLEAVLNTASKPDTFNPAYKKFAKVVETARLAMINGAIALTGKDFDSVVMGFLDGAQDPWLETGDGWSSDGVKFRITYDVTSKVLDRRGIAQATFAAK
ncbi:ClpP-like prohead protease/major capsid protein fusion protein [Photobacterium kishitanii]|uniref:ClpP-like prohead protease/major capsid protein fusion protein n=1 Tax=Photobacterium kishitanii TaxID=318456 RepID=UPI0004349BE4|nr:ClpP-like prohead protease/major capsid protein fusion protein [Photobacterium kishitanii]CEO39403.1 ATP-dependent Clp protease proteolytic subunit [Photobacterium kishitanii]